MIANKIINKSHRTFLVQRQGPFVYVGMVVDYDFDFDNAEMFVQELMEPLKLFRCQGYVTLWDKKHTVKAIGLCYLLNHPLGYVRRAVLEEIKRILKKS